MWFTVQLWERTVHLCSPSNFLALPKCHSAPAWLKTFHLVPWWLFWCQPLSSPAQYLAQPENWFVPELIKSRQGVPTHPLHHHQSSTCSSRVSGSPAVTTVNSDNRQRKRSTFNFLPAPIWNMFFCNFVLLWGTTSFLMITIITTIVVFWADYRPSEGFEICLDLNCHL